MNGGSVSERGWSRKFDEPIEPPGGTQIRALREAVAYLPKTVPKAETRSAGSHHCGGNADIRRGARHCLDLLARMAVLKAWHRHDVLQFNLDAKEHHWGKTKLKRDQ
jgi:hypothetical protein